MRASDKHEDERKYTPKLGGMKKAPFARFAFRISPKWRAQNIQHAIFTPYLEGAACILRAQILNRLY